MKKFKNLAMAFVAAVALLFGGLAASAPAQAVTGSIIWFNQIDGDIPKTIDLRTVRTNGNFEYTSWGEKSWHVRYTCPKSDTFYLTYRNPLGQNGTLGDGECLWPVHEGQYEVGYHLASER